MERNITLRGFILGEIKMITYEYECKTCAEGFCKEQSITDEALTDCLICGAIDSVFRVISGGQGFALTGDGWYKTDFKDK